MKKLTREQIDDLLNQVADTVITKFANSNNQEHEHSMLCIIDDGEGRHVKLIGNTRCVAKSIIMLMLDDPDFKDIIFACAKSWGQALAAVNKDIN